MNGRILIVEDDEALCGALARVASRWGDEILQAHRVDEALGLLETNPTLLIVDVRMPDGSGLDVVEAASRRLPVPTMVAVSGVASAEESFRLAQAGVRAYLAKPLGLDEFVSKVEEALREAPALEPIAAAVVGHRPLRSVQDEMRRTMVDQALARAGGNRSAAARLLQVSRQAVQQMVHERDPVEPGPCVNSDRSGSE
jgi:DNA-binding NtrC family response regulator